MFEAIFSILAGAFLLFYGLCLMGWPLDVTRGVRWLERRSRATRVAVGVALIAAGGLLIVSALV